MFRFMRFNGSIALTLLLCVPVACVDDDSEQADGAAHRDSSADGTKDATSEGAIDLAADVPISLDGAEVRDSVSEQPSDGPFDTDSGDCSQLSEQACSSNSGCSTIRAVALQDVCTNNWTPFFAGCVAGQREGGAALTWAREPGTGRTAQFSSTQLPPGWTEIRMPPCQNDGGAG
jgi:hypothetical protein